MFFPLSRFAAENLVSRDRLGRSVPRQPAHFSHTIRLNMVLTHGIPPAFLDDGHLFIPPTAIGTVPSLSGHAVAHRWRSLPKARRGQ